LKLFSSSIQVALGSRGEPSIFDQIIIAGFPVKEVTNDESTRNEQSTTVGYLTRPLTAMEIEWIDALPKRCSCYDGEPCEA
jgi:hypothetical protein